MQSLFILAVLTFSITFLVWLPHLLAIPFYGLDFSQGFDTIYRNFDGIEYILIAKSLYHPLVLSQLPQPMPASYFASHFPGFALAILTFAPLLGFLRSMLFVSTLFTMLSAWAFYFLVKDFKLTEQPLYLSFLFLILPARWLIVHSVGSSEPMFIFFVISALYFFMKYEQQQKIKTLIISSVLAGLALFTRPPGALLLISLALYIHWNAGRQIKLTGIKNYLTNHLRYAPLLLSGLFLGAIFYWYNYALEDFWAYFHSGDNIHLTFPPFQVFNKSQYWVGDIWLEDIVYVLGLGFLAGITLWKKKLYPLAFYVLVYFTASSFIAHRDISRYTLPAFPFVLIAFEKVLVSKEFKIVLAIIGLGIYLYAQNYILQNTAPYPNVQLFN